jgi:hypothetical protein
MKRTLNKVDAVEPKDERKSRWVCFVRDDVGGGPRPEGEHTLFAGLFFFDMASTPDADKILALFRKYIRDYNEIINLILHLAVKGHHPSYLATYNADEDSDPLEGSNYADLVDELDDPRAYVDDMVAQTKDITSFGTWEYFPSDDADDIDRACERVIRFYTRY